MSGKKVFGVGDQGNQKDRNIGPELPVSQV